MEQKMGPSVPGMGAARSLATLPGGPAHSQMMRFAYREMLTPRMLRQVLAALGAIVAVFTVIGPVSTYETLSPLRRLGYWSLCYFVAWPMFFCMAVVTLYLMRHRSPQTASLSLAGMTLLAGIPATGVVCSIEQLMRPQYLVRLPTLYPRVLAVMLPATILVHLIVLHQIRLSQARPAAKRDSLAAEGAAAQTAPDRAYPASESGGHRHGGHSGNGDRRRPWYRT